METALLSREVDILRSRLSCVLSPIITCLCLRFKLWLKIKLEKMVTDFLWDRWGEGKKNHLVNWEVVSLPKEKGGLAIRNIIVRNIAFIG